MDGMDYLVELLAIVKSHGLEVAFSGDSHDLGRLSYRENITFQSYKEPLRSMRYSLEQAKICKGALNHIKAHLTKKIRNLQNRCKPLVLEDGIKRLPDEILANIFEAGHRISEFYPFALRVSHVSHRFRRISLRTPLIWTKLSSVYPLDQTETYISRSGQLDLRVELRYDPDDKIKSFLPLVTPHMDRWCRLLLGSVPVDDPEIMDLVRLTHFPRLRYISFEDTDVELASSHWDMPLLTHLDAVCSEFLSGASFPFLHQLTNVDLFFNEDGDFDIKSFTDILHSMVGLRNLVLEFRECDLDQSVDVALGTPKPHSFHIESLKVTFRDAVGEHLIFSLYDILEYLTASVVDFSLLNHGEPEDLLDSRFPHGSTIRLHIRKPCSLCITLKKLLEHCKIVRSVEFDRSCFSPLVPLMASHLECFRHLRLHDCVMIEEYIEPMVKSILRHEDFQSLEIISCPKLSEQFLMNLQDEVGERLTWSL